MKRDDVVVAVEPLRAQILMTETGYPARLSVVRDAYGKASMPDEEPGWFWIFATPRASENIRRRGLHAVGTVTRTFIPPQEGITVNGTVSAADIPVVGSAEHTVAMIRETQERRQAA